MSYSLDEATNYFCFDNNVLDLILQQGAARIEEEEAICRRSNGEDCDMTLKNNIEAIIIKWAYQIDEVLSRDSDEELNVPGIDITWARVNQN